MTASSRDFSAGSLKRSLSAPVLSLPQEPIQTALHRSDSFESVKPQPKNVIHCIELGGEVARQHIQKLFKTLLEMPPTEDPKGIVSQKLDAIIRALKTTHHWQTNTPAMSDFFKQLTCALSQLQNTIESKPNLVKCELVAYMLRNECTFRVLHVTFPDYLDAFYKAAAPLLVPISMSLATEPEYKETRLQRYFHALEPLDKGSKLAIVQSLEEQLKMYSEKPPILRTLEILLKAFACSDKYVQKALTYCKQLDLYKSSKDQEQQQNYLRRLAELDFASTKAWVLYQITQHSEHRFQPLQSNMLHLGKAFFEPPAKEPTSPMRGVIHGLKTLPSLPQPLEQSKKWVRTGVDVIDALMRQQEATPNRHNVQDTFKLAFLDMLCRYLPTLGDHIQDWNADQKRELALLKLRGYRLILASIVELSFTKDSMLEQQKKKIQDKFKIAHLDFMNVVDAFIKNELGAQQYGPDFMFQLGQLSSEFQQVSKYGPAESRPATPIEKLFGIRK